TEVIAVEVRQYTGGGEQVLVPRVFGETVRARQRKSAGRGQYDWDEPSFLEQTEQRMGADVARIAARILGWSRDKFSLKWGHGEAGTVTFELRQGDRAWTPLRLNGGRGLVVFLFLRVRAKPPFDDASTLEQFRDRLNEIDGVDLASAAMTKIPRVPMKVF